MHAFAPRPRRTQRGATLIITLVMLMLITVLGLSAIRASTVDEQMAGATRDRERALQAAEAAMRRCLVQLKDEAYPGTVLTPAPLPDRSHWELRSNWSDRHSTEVVVDDNLSSQPRCLVEQLGAGAGSYRVTARALGGSAQTEVVLQATYSVE